MTMGAPKKYAAGEISTEQFVADHTLCYVIDGIMRLYDGNKIHTIKAAECSLVRKNTLIRFMKEKVDDKLEKVFIFLDQPFLKRVQEKIGAKVQLARHGDAILTIPTNALLTNFILSLTPYYKEGAIAAPFTDVKREELLLILLHHQPELATVLFDFSSPEKIDLEEFMNRNYKFNVSMERFAWLSGRSLSAFKRDFKQLFSTTPNHWLVQRRLKEAYFLLNNNNKKASEIYLELGFESLPHFSYAFKKEFGCPPSKLNKK